MTGVGFLQAFERIDLLVESPLSLKQELELDPDNVCVRVCECACIARDETVQTGLSSQYFWNLSFPTFLTKLFHFFAFIYEF